MTYDKYKFPMARIKDDMFKLTGSLGGLSFSQDEHGTIVKMKSTVSKERIKKNPQSQRTRESNMEMGGASRAAKVLRLELLSHGKGFGDRYFSGRLNGFMRKVVGRGEGKPGERKLDLRKNGGLLEEFEFINARPLLYSVGGLKEKPVLNGARNEVRWTSPELNPKQQITAPKEATHFQFLLVAATVSHYVYEPDRKGYVVVEPSFRNCSAFTESEPLALAQQAIGSVTLQLNLPEKVVVPDEVAVVSAVGVRFLKNVNGELLEVEDAGGMRVFGVG